MLYDERYERMRFVGSLTAGCIAHIKPLIKPGISTMDIENEVRMYQHYRALNNSQHGYHGFPGYCCTSINDEVCHGIPSKRILKDGDVVKVDVTFNKNGFHADTCYTFLVGSVTEERQKLIAVAYNARLMGILWARAGNKLSDIAKAINDYVTGEGMSVVGDYYGHGIGTAMHMFPAVPHKPDPKVPDVTLTPGMTFTIEPMINMIRPETILLEDGWTIVTKDGSCSAQFEHTIGITEGDPVIFTDHEGL